MVCHPAGFVICGFNIALVLSCFCGGGKFLGEMEMVMHEIGAKTTDATEEQEEVTPGVSFASGGVSRVVACRDVSMSLSSDSL